MVVVRAAHRLVGSRRPRGANPRWATRRATTRERIALLSGAVTLAGGSRYVALKEKRAIHSRVAEEESAGGDPQRRPPGDQNLVARLDHLSSDGRNDDWRSQRQDACAHLYY